MTQESLVAFQRFPRQNASRSQRVPVRIEEKERDTATQGPRHVLTFMIRRGRLLLAIGGLIDGTGYSGSRERERERWGGGSSPRSCLSPPLLSTGEALKHCTSLVLQKGNAHELQPATSRYAYMTTHPTYNFEYSHGTRSPCPIQFTDEY